MPRLQSEMGQRDHAECECAMTEASFRSCPVHGEHANDGRSEDDE